MPKLHVVGSDGHIFSHLITEDQITIGRSQDNAIALADNTASRSHAQIIKTQEGYVLKDLGSFNGTKVNARSIQSALLHHNDLIEIGLTKITFLSEETEKSSLTDSIIITPDTEYDTHQQKVVGSSSQTAYGGSQELLISAESSKDRTPDEIESAKVKADVSSLERTNKVLFVLYEISSQLNTIQDFNELLKKIMDLIFMVITADTGFLLLTGDEAEDEFIPVVVKYRDEKIKDTEQLKASKTIINKVIHDKVALLTSNAMDDSRLDHAQSVFVQQIRSAICVPLWKKDKIIGVIQLDSLRFENQFTPEDLELLKAIGSQVAMVIEQASLNEQIREEELMRRRLERFNSPQVVEMILKGGQETKDNIMDPQELTATILFTDIIGFTRFSEELPPREVNVILNQYFSRMTDIVFTHDGTLDKYIGDGLMAVFGAPMEKDDDAVRAIRAALDMRRELAVLREEIENKVKLDIRIGINTGRVVAGNIGSPKRLEYTVIGDPVNTASRLESIALPNQILIGEETYQLVNDMFKIKEVGPRMVKGKSAEIMVYEVLD